MQGFDPLYFDNTHSRLTPVRRKRWQNTNAKNAIVSPYFSVSDFERTLTLA